jgi:hypothetical protein
MGNFESEKHELDTQLNSGLYIRLSRMDPIVRIGPVALGLTLSTALIVISDDLQEDA